MEVCEISISSGSERRADSYGNLHLREPAVLEAEVRGSLQLGQHNRTTSVL